VAKDDGVSAFPKKAIKAGKVSPYPRWSKLPGVKKEDAPEAHLSNPKQVSKGKLPEIY
jgi:hypothetical protein